MTSVSYSPCTIAIAHSHILQNELVTDASCNVHLILNHSLCLEQHMYINLREADTQNLSENDLLRITWDCMTSVRELTTDMSWVALMLLIVKLHVVSSTTTTAYRNRVCSVCATDYLHHQTSAYITFFLLLGTQAAWTYVTYLDNGCNDFNGWRRLLLYSCTSSAISERRL